MAVHEPTSPGKLEPGGGRVLRGISHGGQVIANPGEGPPALDSAPRSITTAAEAGLSEADLTVENTSRFDYLFPDLAGAWPDKHLPNTGAEQVVANLKALGAAMVEDPPSAADPLQAANNSTIPAIYTYWGQFIDHDMTANTDRDPDGGKISDITDSPFVPIEPAKVKQDLANLRHPALNLDSLYGDGPTFDPASPTDAASFYDGIKLKVGKIALVSKNPESPIRGQRIPPDEDVDHDLPRKANGSADVGDGRNDENLIVAQLHVAFLRFHNAVVDWVKEHEHDHYTGDEEVFARARQLVQWHYQWLVVHDYLKTVTLTGVADQVLMADDHLLERRDGELYMPLEYSVAAFRFGHTMVRAVYDFNRNFGRPAPGRPPVPSLIPFAPFGLLFLFTGKSLPPFGGDTDVLPFNWVIEWDRMVHKHDNDPDHFARKVDTRLAPPLRDLSNEAEVPEGEPEFPVPIKQILKRLATRNLMRGYLLGIPTGQAVAAELGVAPLTPNELTQDNSVIVNEALEDGGFVEATPLWYYVLKEAEIRGNGNSLGELGSRIVCETIIGQVRLDESSFLNHDWTPHDGVKFADGDAIVSIADLLRFANLLD